MENVPVKIIVKAPNQQFEDQTIQCELSWTIKRLKGYLSEVYPCKPVSQYCFYIYSFSSVSIIHLFRLLLTCWQSQATHQHQ